MIDKNEDLVEMIYEGDLESGLHCMPVKRLIGQLKRLLDKHGRGLTEAEQALYIEQQLEQFLGIKDEAVPGELPR